MADRNKPTRIQFDLKQDSMDRLRALKESTEAASLSEVVRRALQTYEALTREVRQGAKVYIEREDGNGRIEVLPIF